MSSSEEIDGWTGSQDVFDIRETEILRPIEQEKRIWYNDLVANALILQNVSDRTRILPQLAAQRHSTTREILATLSPYLNSHIRRFGDYVMDVDQASEPLLVDPPLEI